MRERFTKPLRSAVEITAGTLLWHGSNLVARRDVSYEYGNVARVKEHLASGRSLIVIINHAHTLDTVVAGHIIEDHVSPLDMVAAITGLKHSDPERYKFDKTVKRKEYVLIHLGKKSRRFRTLRVVQKSNAEREYYTTHPKALEGKSIDQFNSDSMQEARTTLRNGGILMVAPEGTREPEGVLTEAQPGTELLLRGARDNALVLPVGIVLQDDRFKVKIGQAFSYEDLIEEHAKDKTIKLKDLMMRRVARIIPVENRGFYASLVS